jgi:hypothetical protein
MALSCLHVYMHPMRNARSASFSTDTLLNCRTLEAHNVREETWAKQAVRLGCQLGKDPTDVTLTRLFKFRQRQEKLNHIYKSQPIHERIDGPAYWQLSLRNAFSRYVPVGNKFSGLFTEVIEQPPELMNSAAGSTPLEIFGKPIAFDPSRNELAQTLSLSMGLNRRRLLKSQEEKGRAWLQGSYLKVLFVLTSTRLRHQKLVDRRTSLCVITEWG